MKQYFVSFVWPRRARAHTSDMACTHNQQGGDRNPYCTLIKMGTVTGGSGGIEMATVGELYGILHATVSQITSMCTKDKGKDL